MSWLAVGAAAATALAWWLARPQSGWVVRVRLGVATKPRRRRSGPAGAWRIIGPVVAVAVVIVLVSSRPSIVIVAATVVGATLFVLRQVRIARARSASWRTRGETIAALDLLAAELRAGVLPGHAIEALADDTPSLRPAAVAAAHGGDVGEALRSASATPGASVLADLAGAWHVSERAGAPLAHVLDRVATHARDDAEVERDVQAEAAPARATGRLMAVLPVFGLSLGAGMGADPARVLTGTVVGASCLAGGVALACAGILWVDRIVDSVDAG